eukprot:8646668-Alexandrium_andersonii.AAC.1
MELKHANRVGAPGLSLVQRLPEIRRHLATAPQSLADFAKDARDLYHPLRAAQILGHAGHPLLSSAIVETVVVGESGLHHIGLGETFVHAREAKDIVYHIDRHG